MGNQVSKPRGLILLSRQLDPALNLEALRSWLNTAYGVITVIIPQKPGSFDSHLKQVLRSVRPDRLVIGIARGEYEYRQAQKVAQEAGIDPLGVALVDLESHALRLGSPSEAFERAKLLLAGVLLRLLTSPNSQPEHFVVDVSLEVSRRQLLRLAVTKSRTVPTVDVQRCLAELGCRRCLEVCPVTALELQDGTVSLNRTQCAGCAVCQSICPAQAITYPGAGLAELEAQLRQLLNPKLSSLHPRGILFLCERGLLSLESYVASGHQYPLGWLPVVVPCVAMLGLEVYLGTLLLGATTVGVLSCESACPAGEHSIERERIAMAQMILEAAGAEASRVRRLTLSDPLGSEWALMDTQLANQADEPVSGTITDRRLLVQGFLQATASRNAYWVVSHPQVPFGVVTINPSTCTSCHTCTAVCPTGALQTAKRGDKVAITFESALCTACGLCVARCPERAAGALALEARVDAGWLARGRQTITESRSLLCANCGRAFASASLLQRLAILLGEDYKRLAPAVTQYCPDCRGLVSY